MMCRICDGAGLVKQKSSLAGKFTVGRDRSCSEGSAVRVRHHRFVVVVGGWVIVAGLDDLFVRLQWRGCREGAHALFSESYPAQVVLDDTLVVDQPETAEPSGAGRV